jgi:hypothetical protein
MGHAKIGLTLDRYGHLMPGSEAEAAGGSTAISTSSASALRTRLVALAARRLAHEN